MKLDARLGERDSRAEGACPSGGASGAADASRAEAEADPAGRSRVSMNDTHVTIEGGCGGTGDKSGADRAPEEAQAQATVGWSAR